MEISGSVTKRSFSNFDGAFTSHKSVYDDVFGGHTKTGGIPVLAPRLDDYSEIFGGFHTSRSSSIPLIHLPLVSDDPKLHFDVRSPGFSYDEIFRELGGSACTASFEDIVGQSSGYDSSAETWSPVQGASTSDELGPSTGSEKINELPGFDARQTFRSNKRLDSSHCRSSRKHVESGFTRNGHVSSFTADPGCTFSRCDSPASWIEEDEHCSIPVADYVKCSKESAGRLREDKHNKKFSPDQGRCRGSKMQGYDSNPSEKQGNSAFMTVSDISLRTKPSRLPPPSRPPPGLVSKKGECGRSNSKNDVSKDDLFEMMASGSALHFLDVEIDSTSCKENGNDCVGVMCASIEESLEGKELLGSSSVPVEEKTDICASVSSSEEEKVLQSRGEEAVSEPFGEGRINSGKNVHETSKLKGVGLLHREHITDNSADSAAWREVAGYFEVSETKISRYPVEDFDEHSPPDTYLYQKETQFRAFSRMDKRIQPEFSEKHFVLDSKLHKEKPRGSWSERHGLKENIMRGELGNEDDLGMKVPENFEKVETISSGEAKDNVGAMDAKTKRNALLGMRKVEERFVARPILKQNSGKYSIIIPRDAGQRRAENVEHTKTRERAGKSKEPQGIKKAQNGDSNNKNEHKWKGSNELKENVVILEWMNGKSGNTSSVPAMHEKVRDEQLDHESDINEELVHSDEEKVNLLTCNDDLHQVRNDKRCGPFLPKEAFEEPAGDVWKGEDNQLEVSKIIENVSLRGDVCIQKEMHRQTDKIGLAEMSVHQIEVKCDPDSPDLREGNSLKVIDAGCDIGAIAVEDLQKQGDSQMLELNEATFSPEGNEDPKSEPDSKVKKPEGDKVSLVKEDELQDLTTHTAGNNTVEFPRLPEWTDSDIMKDQVSSPQRHHVQLENMHSAEDDGVLKMGGTQLASRRIDSRENSGPCQVTRASRAKEDVVEDASSALESSDATICSMKTATSQKTERNYKRINENLAAKDHEAVEPIRSESRVEDELKRKMEEEREREREREKDRMAVNKAASDARERTYAESRERVVAERVAALVRQRTMTESRERLEKASIEARLRAERAAVERATTEARQRAAERLMIQKTTADGLRVEKPVADRFSASFRSRDTGHNSLPPDLHLQNARNWKKLQSSYSSVHDGEKCESPQRYKARLERCQRTADRVANALAEKNKRDLLAQIEREERNRVAEALDAEVKRWSNGKEGNLRALLSTLQYILGPDSGWQPIPLTEVITSAAVKKAYRRATLCVHPDKLQQRGATVQQKYTSEKVFDLLKEAWNKLNTMEC